MSTLVWVVKTKHSIFQQSASNVQDLVQTFDIAEERCRVQGARLLQPRSKASLEFLFTTRGDYFGDAVEFMEFFPGSMVALGFWYGIHGLDTEPTLYYRYTQHFVKSVP